MRRVLKKTIEDAGYTVEEMKSRIIKAGKWVNKLLSGFCCFIKKNRSVLC